MSNISVSCAEIQTAVGFVFVILPVILNQTLNDPDCEQSWYTEDGPLIADPSDPHKLMYPVTSVSSDHLVTSDCVNLNHEIISDESKLEMETMFRVFNDTDSSGGSTHTPDSQKYHDSVCNKNEPEDLDQTIDEHVHQDHQQLPTEFGGSFHGLNYKKEANVEIQVLLQKTEGLTMENEGKWIKRSSSMDMLINFSDEGPDEIDEIPEMKNQIGLGNTHNTCSEARSIYFEQNRSEIKPWPVIFVIKLKIVI
ncbi:uncharacterized protein LOC125247771 [Megalobrama amblycephala]|uniref:uncharacterized protein LOC125247771 n=1 Tax=Megalobrama amblycephala TaxID=75352 RepID=UPI0020145E5D|nr:uncharacterized protein LOC125247771 [Megalobrama amblycephala]XP_048015216.1 uncharacterized protein LOC125247771 [Megalobrama amblycephala]XP_048015224.1 uncharacterized protein LOC125247771 [Megalobrama amblycephala]XP_048015230.1 uncharacterized protein LOC125247771 [Megalobrama amblycephala]